MKQLFIVLHLLLLVAAAEAQMDDTTGFYQYEKRLFIQGNDTLRYRVLYPLQYNSNKPVPLIMFMHGSGERGNDNEKQLWHGGALFLKDSIRNMNPAIVIFPQCPNDSAWNRFNRSAPRTDSFYLSLNHSTDLSTPERLVKLLMDSLAQHRITDKKRMYIGGLSLGGFGTYDLLTKYPNYFAAAFPICGMTNVPLYTQRAYKVPLWIFHGAKDDVVSPEPDRLLYKALQTKKGARVQYTEYPDVGHNSWDNAFAEPNLLPWVLTQKR
jgi:predicted peptidase